jgi:hypothetical protein
MEEVKIYFADLSKDKQEELLEAYDAEGPEEMNWDYFPVAIVPIEEKEEAKYAF